MSRHFYSAVLRDARLAAQRTRHMEFEMQNGQRFAFLPGQFISLSVGQEPASSSRLYSIASAPRADNRFDLCLRLRPDDAVSSEMFNLKRGEVVRFSGPFGFFTLREPPDSVSVFIAAGTGIAPIRAMLQQLYRRPYSGEAWLFFGVRSEPDILYRTEFEKLAQENPGFHFLPSLSRPEPTWAGLRGYVQSHIPRYLAGKTGLHAYACGQRKMIDDVTQALRRMGRSSEAISSEEFD